MRMEQDVDGRQSIVHCEHISKTFYTKKSVTEVIRDVTIDVAEKEFVVFFGPGQCGKTTLINCLSGLEPVTSGRVVVNGEVVTKPGYERGVVYQTTAIFPWLTVMGNVEYGPKARGMAKQTRQELAQRYIDLVGLSGFEKSFPNQLSGGMRQRVGIARAYANEPAVLFMDEPFGHLDAQTRYLMQNELMRIWEQDKRTVIFVTNNIEEALFLADRIVVLNNCPTAIKREYRIDLPRPRDVVSKEFLDLRKEITELVDKSM